ncbi:RNase H family protein [Clostridium tertium]|uniref:RNase H family protein n=1 Tax=Clostridium tertium TaxID=1559 RepID=UPI00232D742D|nr:RNase H family protein [Clostridium tertium]
MIELSGKYNNKENLSMRNVAGELLGAIEAMKWALSNRIKDINIYYDYEGIERWALGIWKTNKKGAKEYKEFFDSIKEVLNINFIKVKAHSGVKYNEEADRLAKKEFETVYEIKDQNTKRDYSDILYTIIDEDVKETTKNTCTILFQGKRISDNKLKKLAKQIWKNNKRKVSEINNMNIIFNFDNRSLEIEIRDVYNEIYKYEIKL